VIFYCWSSTHHGCFWDPEAWSKSCHALPDSSPSCRRLVQAEVPGQV
jgi:hypothetical protein